MTAQQFDLADPDSGVVLESRTLNAPGATTGDVLTVNADKSVSPAPGGGSMPVQGTYGGDAVTVNDGDIGNLTWDALVLGTELLDRTDPANPTFLADGFYALVVDVTVQSAFTLGGSAQLALGAPTGNVTNALAFGAFPEGSAAATFHAVSGDPIPVQVQNLDGAAARDFKLTTAILVKLA